MDLDIYIKILIINLHNYWIIHYEKLKENEVNYNYFNLIILSEIHIN